MKCVVVPFPITPVALLIVAIWLTGVAWAVDLVARRRRAQRLRRLAAEWGMTYNPLDRLQLARRAGPHFPVIGAADLRVSDVIYGSDKGRYRYVFTAAYTVGTTGPKRRLVRAATFTEPRGRDTSASAGPVVLAPGEGSLVDQYRRLAPAERRPIPPGFPVAAQAGG